MKRLLIVLLALLLSAPAFAGPPGWRPGPSKSMEIGSVIIGGTYLREKPDNPGTFQISANGTDWSDFESGTSGNGVLNGTGEPAAGLGANGDFYIDTTDPTEPIFYGPKAAGAWGTGASMKGDPGADGSAGADGKTILSGAVDPTTEGVDGDFYINTATATLFGPKATTWPAGTVLIGADGVDGTDGSNGTDGKTILNGAVDPTTEGVDGDFYINTATWKIFGPKATTWPAGVSMLGDLETLAEPSATAFIARNPADGGSYEVIYPDGTTVEFYDDAGTSKLRAILPTSSSLSVDDLITLSGVAEGSQHLGAFTGSTIADNQTIKVALQALETAVEGAAGGHDALTLSTAANDNLLSLSTQELGLDTQTANYGFFGPTSGGAAAPAFRAMVAADIPNDLIDSQHYADASIDLAHLSTDSVNYEKTTGSFKALTPVTDAAADFATAFTGANLYGGTFIANTAGTAVLPAVAAGMNFTIITLGDIAVVVDPNANDRIIHPTTGTGADGASLTNLSTGGDIIVCQYESAAGWLCISNGWTAE